MKPTSDVPSLLETARGIARRWCRSSADADDVAQDAMFLMCSRAALPQEPAAWLFVVTRRLAHRRRRRDDSRTLAELGYALDARSWDVRADIEIDAKTILGRLGDRDRRLILLMIEGATSSEIASEMRCQTRDVGQIVSRARRKARSLYRK